MTRALERHREQFHADPARSLSFEALEEHHFLASEWEELALLYARRLEAPALRQRGAERVRLLFRLGQILEERCGDPARALQRYRQAVELEPSFGPALRQLRRIYGARGQWELVLQVAEVEGALPMHPYEASAFHAELGQVWAERMNDAAQALVHFDRALESAPGAEAAASGRARCLVALGRAEEAARVWAALLERVTGTERAPILLALAELFAGPLGQPDRAFEAYRRALTENPRCREALDALVTLASDRGQWPMVAELQERRFGLAAEGSERLAIALEAGELELRRLRNPHASRLWYRRAEEIAPERAEVQLALAEVERLAGHRDELARHLERALALDASALSVAALLELATLAAARGAHEDAVERARLALGRATPAEEPLVLAALDGHLSRAGRPEERLEILERRAALAEEPRARAVLLAELGALLESDRSEPRPAWDAYRRAFDADPSLGGLSAAIERVLGKAEAWDALRTHLESAAERGPEAERSHVLCALGEVLAERLQDPDGAVRAFEAALTREPACETALRGLERVALRQGDGETILRAYEREVAIASEPARRVHLLREIVRLLEASDRAEEALMWADRLAAATPEDASAHATCARLQELLDDPAGLAATLEKLDLLCAPEERAANRRRLAELHRALADDDRAVAWCRAALEAEPGHLGTLESLADLLERAGRLRELAEVHRELAEREEPSRRGARLDALACLLADGLGDLEGACATLRRLAAEPNPPPDVEERLEALLVRRGCDAELAEHLGRRRAALAAGDPRAEALDLRRGELLLERLDRPHPAAEIFRSVLAGDPGCGRAERGLEAALRAGNDLRGLAALLAERAARAGDAAARERILLERAELVERGLRDAEEARRALTALADSASDTDVRSVAEDRLGALLERRGEWAALRARLEARLDPGDAGSARELHERIAALALDRLADRAGALAHLEAAARLAPGRAELWRRLALLYDEDARPAELLRVIEAELATQPDAEREVRLRSRAATLCRGGDPGRAEVHYRRVLELSPGQPEAANFLAARFEAEGRHAELLAVLEPQLAILEAQDDPANGRCSLSLRLRIASLRAGPLGDAEGALASLEPALRDDAALLLVAEPLAALYERTGRSEDLVELCQRAAGACELPGERAEWQLRLGAALRRQGREAEAARAYAEALVQRPGDRSASSALCELYRSLGEAEPLSRLLEEELARVGGRDEIPLRAELAELRAGPLGDPAAALVHQRRILDLDPGHAGSLARAIELSAELGQHELLAALLDAALRRTREPGVRAALLARKGALLAEVLGRPEDALAAFRAALFAAPRDGAARRGLRQVLESQARWREVLDLLHLEADEATGEDRGRVLQEAAALAARRLGDEAALPWLERLRREQPADAATLARIAEIHGAADRPHARLRALEAELALGGPPGRRRELHAGRAEVLERGLGLPVEATRALEEALTCAPGDLQVLHELDRLNSLTNRPRARADVLQSLTRLLQPGERNAARRARAWLLAGPLGEPAEAARVLEEALGHPDEGELERGELLRSLGAAYRAAGRPSDFARVAEEELLGLDPEDGSLAGRRADLQGELARLYGRELADPARELVHLRALADGEAIAAEDRTRAEATLLDRLRATGDTVELADRLAHHLARETRDSAGWLELARLEEERFGRPAAGAEAYGRVLAVDPARLDALRGLRRCAERLGDPEALARALEGEVEHDASLPPAARATILRRVGGIAWRDLGSTTRASRAFARALEAEPGDLASLRALEELFESMDDWRGALDFYESEVETLGEAEPERRRSVWLRVAALARDRTHDPRRALRAFEAASRIAPLEPPDQLAFAELALASGDPDRFAALFAVWCDDPRAGARALDELRLSVALAELDHDAEALLRAERAVGLDPGCAPAWDAVANLRAAAGDAAGRADALERAAELVAAGQAVERLCAAAEAVAGEDPARALAFLVRAAGRDPASIRAHAALALRASVAGELETAARAALRALELDGSNRELELAERAELARAGGRAAHARSDVSAAAELFEALLDAAPGDLEGLAAWGELSLQRGEPDRALALLDRRLASPSGDAAERARLVVLRARALEEMGRVEEALAACEEARGLDASRREILAIRARLLEGAGRVPEAVQSLELHASSATDPIEKARILEKISRLALGEPSLAARAESWLREATRLDPASGSAWLLLVRRLAGEARAADALAVANEALANAGEGAESAEIAALRAEALEGVGERHAAADAHREVARRNPARLDAGLASARLYRSLGEWRAGAEVLSLLADAESADPPGLAAVLYQLGRLRAGPLEDVPGAIDAYRRALARRPQLMEARFALADLLGHCPEHRAEALALHRTILAESPCRVTSLRTLVRLAAARSPGAEAAGLAVLRALGVASPDERERASAVVAPPPGPSLDDPLFECARELVRGASAEIGQALLASSGGFERPTEDPVARFRARVAASEAELSAPGLGSLASEELATLVAAVARLAVDVDSTGGEGPLGSALAAALGRRTRRRLERVLQDRGITAGALASIDFAAWRAELRALAAAEALRRTGETLRTALLALLGDEPGRRPAPEADLGPLVERCPEARALVRRIVLSCAMPS
ncbi:MAG TPA: hypothetical protein VFG80_05290 [Myxococcota bacterium]|nr:hypothetical protein [Myxococcota bacterium]